jgi:hypothetical protein
MPMTMDALSARIRAHRCYSHPVFRNWAAARPDYETIGAMFPQIQLFCSSTRCGGNFPDALAALGLEKQSTLVNEIVDSETGHGRELAMMAGHIINRAAGRIVCSDLADQTAIEELLKRCSDRVFSALPGYDAATGQAAQTRRTIEVLERRQRSDRASSYRNLGTVLALEIIANRHVIPGEKQCLVDSGLYGVSMSDPEMHYLLEHWGEIGAEQQHEDSALTAVAEAIDDATESEIVAGIDDFLNSLASLWDVLSALLQQSRRSNMDQVAAD